LLWTCVGLAGGASGLLAGQLRTAGRERKVLAVAMVLSAPAVWPLGAGFGLGGLAGGLLIVGLLAGPVDVSVLTLRLRRTPPADFPRVLSVSMSLNQVGFPIGMALAGPLLAGSASASFAVAAFILALAGLAAWTLIPVRDATG
ncbi:MAG: hypothetical protein ACJ8AW_38800, partial [Rhodopila sp.]